MKTVTFREDRYVFKTTDTGEKIPTGELHRFEKTYPVNGQLSFAKDESEEVNFYLAEFNKEAKLSDQSPEVIDALGGILGVE